MPSVRSSLLLSLAALLLVSGSDGAVFPTWTGPSSPANNNAAPSSSATNKLSQYTNIVNIWLGGSSFDYLYGAFPGANGIANARAGWNPQLTSYGGPAYSCLDTTTPVEQTAVPVPTSVPACWPNTGPFPVDQAVPLVDNSGNSITWSHDPSHNFYSDIYQMDGGKMDLYSAIGGINAYGVSYYNTSLSGSYLWSLAKSYTLFDNFFKSMFGDSDVNFLLGIAAGQPIYWGDSSSACYTASSPYYSPVTVNATTGMVTGKYNVFSNMDCHVVGEADPGLASYSYPVNVSAAPRTPFVSSQHFGNLLDAAGVSWSMYLQDFNVQYFGNATALQPGEPTQGADGSTYSGHNNPFGYYTQFAPSQLTSAYRTAHMQDLDALYVQLASNTLPQVVWTSFSESYDMAISDSNIADGSAYLQFVIQKLQASSYWQNNKMLIAVTWSDNGALYDHVPPYAGDQYGPGARVPLILISPDHANGGVNHQPYEHLSLMKMISTRFGVKSSLLSAARQTSTRDLTNSFDETPKQNNGASSVQVSLLSLALVLAVTLLCL